MIWIIVLVNWQISKCLKTKKITKFNRGAKAPQAAGRIHTDFEKGFIMAEVSFFFAVFFSEWDNFYGLFEVMKFADYKEGGSDAAVKASGGYR